MTRSIPKNIQLNACLLLACCTTASTLAEDSEITKVLTDIEIIPDVLVEAPTEFLKIEYENGVIAEKGNELTPTQTKDAPKLIWTSSPDTYYTVLMTNPDAPDRAAPKWREWLHWLVVNVPGVDMEHGEMLAPYIGPAPPKNAGIMRYVFLVFQQPEKLFFDETPLNDSSLEGHNNFVSMQFAQKYGMGTPVAGNVFQAQWDDYVPILHKQLHASL